MAGPAVVAAVAKVVDLAVAVVPALQTVARPNVDAVNDESAVPDDVEDDDAAAPVRTPP